MKHWRYIRVIGVFITIICCAMLWNITDFKAYICAFGVAIGTVMSNYGGKHYD